MCFESSVTVRGMGSSAILSLSSSCETRVGVEWEWGGEGQEAVQPLPVCFLICKVGMITVYQPRPEFS